jgi:hypothetical protein
MKNRSLIETLNEMNRAEDEMLGDWCPAGGVSTSIACIIRKTGSRAIFDRPGPAEGRRATLVTSDGQSVTLTQHWHGGPETGDWWWTL